MTLLERILALDSLQPWHTNRLSRLVKTPKLHLGDTGLAGALLGVDEAALAEDRALLGQLLESFVYGELRRQASWHEASFKFHHFRDRDGFEVDLVLEKQGRDLARSHGFQSRLRQSGSSRRALSVPGSLGWLSRNTIAAMAILDLFSKRQARLRGEAPDVFSYDELPQELRVQLVHFLRDYVGNEREVEHRHGRVHEAFDFIVSSLHREYGTFRLAGKERYDEAPFIEELVAFVLTEVRVERVLDAVELACKVIDFFSRTWDYRQRQHADELADQAPAELNARFLEHGVGYRYEAGSIVRVDSEFVHSEVVKPALALLHDPRFKGAEAEFHLAFEHYRHGRKKEALAECLKALESTMKSIATERKWTFDSKATAKPLVDLMFQKGVVPELWSQHFSGLRGMLESGVPTARNRLGGHGQGTEVVTVPPHFVAFALHQTAAAIVFLATAEKQLQ